MIINPVSGRGNMFPRVRRIQRIIEKVGASCELLITERATHATRLASELGDSVEALLVVGGDGTVSEVINGLKGRPLPMVLLRTGTENLLARALSMPIEAGQVARTLLYGKVYAIDAGLLNGRRFGAIAGIGFDAECVLRMTRIRRGHITHWDYFWPIWRSFWAYGFPRMRFQVDGRCVFEGRGLAILGSIPLYSAGLRILQNARYDDGLLDLCIYPCASRTRLLRLAAKTFFRRHILDARVHYFQFHRIQVESEDSVPVEIDGEAAGFLPMECEVAPGDLQFIA